MIAFVLSMPNAGSWNDKWTGEGRLYARVKKLKKEEETKLNGKSFRYCWDDGWTACICCEKVDAKEAAKIRKKSVGFMGYDWMIDSIIEKGEIKYEKQTH